MSPDDRSLAGIENPFADRVMRDAWQEPASEVTGIHEEVFASCRAGLDAARAGRSDSLLIFGEPGSGKTHVINRLRRSVDETGGADPGLGSVFVYVRLQTSPSCIWQHVRRCLATDLLRNSHGLSQLQRLVAHQLAEWPDTDGARHPPSYFERALRVLPQNGENEAAASYFDRISEKVSLSWELHQVLRRLVQRQHFADAQGWLRGDSISEAALERLGLSSDEVQDREQAARNTVTELCRLAGATLPIVFCFDQIEALQRRPDDDAAFYAFGHMAADLSDSDPNVFIISCIQTTMRDRLLENVHQADLARVFRRRTDLQPLDLAETRALVMCRLDRVPALATMRVGKPLHPFEEKLLESIPKHKRTPREIMRVCSDRFEALQARSVGGARVEEFLSLELEQRKSRDVPVPDAAKRVALGGLPIIWELARASRMSNDGEEAELRAPEVAIAVCNETNMRSLAGRLARLRAIGARPLVIARDERLPIPRTAKKTRQYLTELETNGGRLVMITEAATGALAALYSIISDARAGDLTHLGETVRETTVSNWLRAAMKTDDALAPLRDLVDDIASTQGSSCDAVMRDLMALLDERYVVLVEEAVRELPHSREALVGVAASAPERIGFLAAAPEILYLRTYPRAEA
jgi:hypothetical protein